MFKRIIALLICFCLIFEQAGFAQVAPQLVVPGYLSDLSPVADRFRPVQLRSIGFNPASNDFQLLLDKGDLKNLTPSQAEESSQKLFEYFKIGLALPNSMFWVNLRPDSPDNIIDPYVEKTDVGKVLLEADLQLKKDLARFTNPDTVEGRQYWNKLYEKAEQVFGLEDAEIPTFTRPWIVPGEIILRESTEGAFIYKATLKVMLEQDYLKDSPFYKFDDPRLKEINEYSSGLIRQLIIPRLTRKVNSSRRYAQLRQVYYSLILAQWFKSKNQDNPVIDKKDLNGLASQGQWSKTAYFNSYKKSFSEGEYRKEETIQGAGSMAIRQYFSGGITFNPNAGLTLISGRDGGAFETNESFIRINVGRTRAPAFADGGLTTDPDKRDDHNSPEDLDRLAEKRAMEMSIFEKTASSAMSAARKADPDKPLVLVIAGVISAGKTGVKESLTALLKAAGEAVVFLDSERFLIPAEKRDSALSYPRMKFDVDEHNAVLAGLKKGQTVFVRFTDRNTRQHIALTQDHLRRCLYLSKEWKGYGQRELGLIADEEIIKPIKEYKAKAESRLWFDKENGEVFEEIIPGKEVFLVISDVALIEPYSEKRFDFSCFVWMPRQERKKNFIDAWRRGEQYAGIFNNENEVADYFDVLAKDDEILLNGVPFADAVVKPTRAAVLYQSSAEQREQKDGGLSYEDERAKAQRELIQEYYDARGIDSFAEDIPVEALAAMADDILKKKHALVDEIAPLMLACFGIPSQKKSRRFTDLLRGDLRAWTYGNLLLLREDMADAVIQEKIVELRHGQSPGILSQRFKTIAVFAFLIVPSFFIGGIAHAYLSSHADSPADYPHDPVAQPSQFVPFYSQGKIPFAANGPTYILSDIFNASEINTLNISIAAVVEPLPGIHLVRQNSTYSKTQDRPLLLVVDSGSLKNLRGQLNDYQFAIAREGHVIEIFDTDGKADQEIAAYITYKSNAGYQIGFLGDQAGRLSDIAYEDDALNDLKAQRDLVNNLIEKQYGPENKGEAAADFSKYVELSEARIGLAVSRLVIEASGRAELDRQELDDLSRQYDKGQEELDTLAKKLGPIIPETYNFRAKLNDMQEAGDIDRYVQAGNNPVELFPAVYSGAVASHWSSYIVQGAFESIVPYHALGNIEQTQDTDSVKDIQQAKAIRMLLETKLNDYQEKYNSTFEQDYAEFVAGLGNVHTIVYMNIAHGQPDDKWTKEKRIDMCRILDIRDFPVPSKGYHSFYQAQDGHIYASEEEYDAYSNYSDFRDHVTAKWASEPAVARALTWIYLIEPELVKDVMSDDISIDLEDKLPLPNPWASGMTLPGILTKGSHITLLRDTFLSYPENLQVRTTTHELGHVNNEIKAYNEGGPLGVIRWALWYLLNPGDEETDVRERELAFVNVYNAVAQPYFSDRITSLEPEDLIYLQKTINDTKAAQTLITSSDDLFPEELRNTYELTTRGALLGLIAGAGALFAGFRTLRSQIAHFAGRAFSEEDLAEQINALKNDSMVIVFPEGDDNGGENQGQPAVPTDGSPAQRDGGAGQEDVAGIDFRVLTDAGQPSQLPAMPQVSQELQNLEENSSIQDLAEEWKEIEAQMATNEMPYARLKEYIAVCATRPDARQYLDRTICCILNILRLEEEQALSTQAELKDILVCLG